MTDRLFEALEPCNCNKLHVIPRHNLESSLFFAYVFTVGSTGTPKGYSQEQLCHTPTVYRQLMFANSYSFQRITETLQSALAINSQPAHPDHIKVATLSGSPHLQADVHSHPLHPRHVASSCGQMLFQTALFSSHIGRTLGTIDFTSHFEPLILFTPAVQHARQS